METYLAVWNCNNGDTRIFSSLDEYEIHAKNGGTGEQSYCVWDDEIFKVKAGQNIFEGEEIEHRTFKESF